MILEILFSIIFKFVKRREVFFQVKKRNFENFPPRQRSNPSPQTVPFFSSPQKFHTFQYLHYEPPGCSKNNPPRRPRDNGQASNRGIPSPGPRCHNIWARGQSYGPFLDPRFPSVSDQAERFLADSLSSLSPFPQTTPCQYQASGVRSPFPRIDFQRNVFLFFSSFLFFFSPPII